uniref:Cyclin-dependent kinase 2-associated protein 1 isoform X1 n=1 Tax=Phascolarctos cinereus TaxID=38626 RepID=A0A6P5J3Y3_PHACI|nr:cyclin-dependent kinase 2-associated protein 1 isoform X1 [Phascolarctos cinereus]
MPRQAFLSQEEKQARARERDRLKKRRRREDSLKRSLERQRNAEAMKRRREDEKQREKERRKDREAKRRRRENVQEREKEQKKDREAKKRRRREKKEEREKALYQDMAALTQLWERGEDEEEEEEEGEEEEEEEEKVEEREERERREKEQTSVFLGTPASLIWGTGSSQVPQSKYAELLAIIEELGKEIRPTYAGSKSAMERLKRASKTEFITGHGLHGAAMEGKTRSPLTSIIHARGLVRECLAETERNARS